MPSPPLHLHLRSRAAAAESPQASGPGPNISVIIGVVLGVVIAVVSGGAVVWWHLRRRRRHLAELAEDAGEAAFDINAAEREGFFSKRSSQATQASKTSKLKRSSTEFFDTPPPEEEGFFEKRAVHAPAQSHQRWLSNDATTPLVRDPGLSERGHSRGKSTDAGMAFPAHPSAPHSRSTTRRPDLGHQPSSKRSHSHLQAASLRSLHIPPSTAFLADTPDDTPTPTPSSATHLPQLRSFSSAQYATPVTLPDIRSTSAEQRVGIGAWSSSSASPRAKSFAASVKSAIPVYKSDSVRGRRPPKEYMDSRRAGSEVTAPIPVSLSPGAAVISTPPHRDDMENDRDSRLLSYYLPREVPYRDPYAAADDSNEPDSGLYAMYIPHLRAEDRLLPADRRSTASAKSALDWTWPHSLGLPHDHGPGYGDEDVLFDIPSPFHAWHATGTRRDTSGAMKLVRR